MDFPSSSNKQAFSYGWFYACNDDEKWQWRDTNSFANTSYTQIYRIELPEENGKEYTLEEFHKIFWWWCIGTYATGDNDYCIENNMINGNLGVYTGFSNTGTWNIKNDTYSGYGLGSPGKGRQPDSLEPHVMTDNVTAIYRPTSNTNPTSLGNCSITISYNKNEKVWFNIEVQRRGCIINNE